jgi:hypothetical protein
VVTKKIDFKTLQTSLLEKLIKPYFSGIKRYVKKGEILLIGDIEFIIT